MPWIGIAGSYGSSFTVLNSTTGILSPPLALFIVMLSKARLTSHSKMSISRWVSTPPWLPGSLRPSLYSYSVYSCHLFLASSASVKSFLFLFFYGAHPCMKCSLGISSFLEEISSLSHSVVFSMCLNCSLKRAFLSLLAILWNSVFSWVCSNCHIVQLISHASKAMLKILQAKLQ